MIAVKTCDFSRSFITFVTQGRGNNARIQVEARCLLTDISSGTEDEYFLVASCKGEDTYGKGILFLDPNYDFCGIFSRQEFRLIRVGVPFRTNETLGDVERFFEEVKYDIVLVEGKGLTNNEAIVQATLSNQLLNGRTTLNDAGRYRATIEFPIKTMNANDIEHLYQVDTGPLLLPDFRSQARRIVERFDLAFVAFNKPDEAYFVIQGPMSICGTEEPQVSHYHRIVRMDTENEVIALR